MTMLSFRVDDAEVAAVSRWAKRLGSERSELLREALHSHLVRLAAEADIASWELTPPTDSELSLSEISDWGPAEDWSDWADAQG